MRQAPPWAGLSARAALGAVLAVAGTLKAAGPAEEFAIVIEAYGLVPTDAALTLATFLPWVELIAGVSLIAGYFTRAAAAAAAAMLLSFIFSLAWVKLKGIPLPNCGCFGPGFHPSPGQTMALDSLLALLSLLAFQSGASLCSLDAWAAAADGEPMNKAGRGAKAPRPLDPAR